MNRKDSPGGKGVLRAWAGMGGAAAGQAWREELGLGGRGGSGRVLNAPRWCCAGCFSCVQHRQEWGSGQTDVPPRGLSADSQAEVRTPSLAQIKRRMRSKCCDWGLGSPLGPHCSGLLF